MYNLLSITLRQSIWWLVSPEDHMISSPITVLYNGLSIINPIIYYGLGLPLINKKNIYLLKTNDFLVYTNTLLLHSDIPLEFHIEELQPFEEAVVEFLYLLRHWSKQDTISMPNIIERYSTVTMSLPTLPKLLSDYRKNDPHAIAGRLPPHASAAKFNSIEVINSLHSKGEPLASQIIFFDAICAYQRDDYVMSILYTGFAIEILLLDALSSIKTVEANALLAEKNDKSSSLKFRQFLSKATKCIAGRNLAEKDSQFYNKICTIYGSRGEIAHSGYDRNKNHYFGEYKYKALDYIKAVKSLFCLLIQDDSFIVPQAGNTLAYKIDPLYFSSIIAQEEKYFIASI